MIKNFFTCMLISTAAFGSDNRDDSLPFCASPSPLKIESAQSSSDSYEPLMKRARVEKNNFFLLEEIIAQIASFARISDGIRISNTCSQWRKALKDYNIWAQYYFPRMPGYTSWVWEKFKPEGQEENRDIIKRLITPAVNLMPLDNTSVGGITADGQFGLGVQYSWSDNPITVVEVDLKSGILNPIDHSKSTRKDLVFAGFIGTSKALIGYTKTSPKAIKFTPSEEVVFLKNFKSIPCLESKAEGSSANGEVVVGSYQGPDRLQAVRWVNGEIESLDRANTYFKSEAKAVSGDGKTIAVMVYQDEDDEGKPYCWTEEEGLQALPLIDNAPTGLIQAINPTGNVIVGTSRIQADDPSDAPVNESSELQVNETMKAVRWVKGEVELLDNRFDEEEFSVATAVSEDGEIIGGKVEWKDPLVRRKWHERGFIWNPQQKMQFLDTVFRGIKFDEVKSIIADGTVFIGSSSSPQGNLYFAYIPRADALKKEGLKLQNLDLSSKKRIK